MRKIIIMNQSVALQFIIGEGFFFSALSVNRKEDQQGYKREEIQREEIECTVFQYLNGSATGRDVCFHSSGVISSSKLLLLRLPSLHNGDRHQLFIHPGIQVQYLKHLHPHDV